MGDWGRHIHTTPTGGVYRGELKPGVCSGDTPPQFPHLYNLTGLMINYQQRVIECLLDSRPDTVHAWCVAEALPQKKEDS